MSTISRDEMFRPMLDACPSFQPLWQAFVSEWREEGGELPLYLALDELAGHLVSLIQKGEVSELNKVFAVIERWQLEGDDNVRLALSVGLFERIKRGKGATDLATKREFVSRLRPASKAEWNKV